MAGLHLRLHAMPRPLAGGAIVVKISSMGTGPKDRRLPKAVWRGSTGGFGGLEKGRAALLNLGMAEPDLIDSGVLDWDYERYGPDEGRLKEKMEFGHQVCAPSRL